MDAPRVLVTGGAGFIGSHIVDALLMRGYNVTVYDNLDPQVHGPERRRPDYLNPDVPLIVGDVCDRETLKNAPNDIEIVYRQAAAVGGGQSMYDILRYTRINTMGAANAACGSLLDIIANEKYAVCKMMQMNMPALEKAEANYEVFIVGTGRMLSIRDVADALVKHLGVDIQPDLRLYTGRQNER